MVLFLNYSQAEIVALDLQWHYRKYPTETSWIKILFYLDASIWKDYIAAMSQLSAETIYQNNSKTIGKFVVVLHI